MQPILTYQLTQLKEVKIIRQLFDIRQNWLFTLLFSYSNIGAMLK
jgi:hypothetical protein